VILAIGIPFAAQAAQTFRIGGIALNNYLRYALIFLFFCVISLALNAHCAESRKPRIVILTTGGTIAAQADPRSAIGDNSGALSA
jgi:L-asparaginase/Glu-tRNA(Gln) amidotransferase subunit D